MLARYDLNFEHPTFDFFGWGVMAVAAGATGFVIEENTQTDDLIAERRRRLESIILPGAALFGLPVELGQHGDRFLLAQRDRWKLRDLIAWTRAGNQFARLRSIKAPAAAKYTVTLRNSRKSPYRNSDDRLWRTFALAIGAQVIEDYADRPIELAERLALYAGAQMNFGVWSGPMFLITLTDYPCACFNWGVDEPAKIRNSGIAWGEPPPWLKPNQFTFWEKATAQSLERAAALTAR